MNLRRSFWTLAVALLCCFGINAAEVIPPAPEFYFNDYAHVVSTATANQLNHALADFERQSSSQIWVAIFPKMQSESSVEDYTVRVARAWKTGQKLKNNGAILFVFTQDHKLYIQVGYGLEGALPDALCKQIIDTEITPYFKRGDFDGGLKAGVAALMSAAKGEYKGTGKTVADNAIGIVTHSSFRLLFWGALILFFIIISLLRSGYRPGRSYRYGNVGWSIFQVLLNILFSGGWSIGNDRDRSGGSWSGSSDNDRASGGGGSFGGGGAGGSW